MLSTDSQNLLSLFSWSLVFLKLLHSVNNVGPDDDEFTVEVHHGGFFCGHGSNRSYVGGKRNWFDHCETDTWSPLWMDDFVQQLGYEESETLKLYWCLPGKHVGEGLRIIKKDADTNSMVAVTNRHKNLVMYVDHDNSIGSVNCDDIVAEPVAYLPKVMSPKKVAISERIVDEKLSSFYDDIITPCKNRKDKQGA